MSNEMIAELNEMLEKQAARDERKGLSTPHRIEGGQCVVRYCAGNGPAESVSRITEVIAEVMPLINAEVVFEDGIGNPRYVIDFGGAIYDPRSTTDTQVWTDEQRGLARLIHIAQTVAFRCR